MVGQNVYTTEQIEYLLDMFIEGKDGTDISQDFLKRYKIKLSSNQLRYVRNKYGKDPKFNTAMINTVMRNKKRKRLEKPESSKLRPSPRIEAKKMKKDSLEAKKEKPHNLSDLSEVGVTPQSKPCEWSIPPLHQHMQQPRMQQVVAAAQLQVPTTYQPPAMDYPLPVPNPQFDFSSSFLSPLHAPIQNADASVQGQIPNQYHQGIQSPLHGDGHNIGQFNFGNIGMNMNSAPTMATSTFRPQVSHQTSMAAHTQLHHELPGLPMGLHQMVASPHYTQHHHIHQTVPVQSAPEYDRLLLNQPPEPYFNVSQFSPAATMPAPTGRLCCSPQQGSVMTQVKTDLGEDKHTFSNANWKPFFNANQQQQLDQGTSSVSVPEESKLLTSSHAMATFPNNNNADVLPVVVSNQTSGSMPTIQPVLDDPLTTNLDIHIDPCGFIDCSNSIYGDTGADSGHRCQKSSPPPPHHSVVNQDRAILMTLYPHLEHKEALSQVHDAVVSEETIDPKLLAEMYTLPPLRRGDTTTPAEEQPKTPADLVKLEAADG